MFHRVQVKQLLGDVAQILFNALLPNQRYGLRFPHFTHLSCETLGCFPLQVSFQNTDLFFKKVKNTLNK